MFVENSILNGAGTKDTNRGVRTGTAMSNLTASPKVRYHNAKNLFRTHGEGFKVPEPDCDHSLLLGASSRHRRLKVCIYCSNSLAQVRLS